MRRETRLSTVLLLQLLELSRQAIHFVLKLSDGFALESLQL